MSRSRKKTPAFAAVSARPHVKRRWKRAHHRRRRMAERQSHARWTRYDKSVTPYKDFSATGGLYYDSEVTPARMRK
jgi:hypothetical protein